jgi:hypothetical protein
MRRTRGEKLGLAALSMLAALIATGCTGGGPGGTVCPAIGYFSTVRVTLVGNADDVTEVRLCDAEGNCSSLEGAPAVDEVPLVVVEPGELGENVEEPELSSTPVATLYRARHDGGSSWSVWMPTSVPEDDVVVTARLADGSVVGETTVALEWRRIGGSEQCGGPTEAGPIDVVVS